MKNKFEKRNNELTEKLNLPRVSCEVDCWQQKERFLSAWCPILLCEHINHDDTHTHVHMWLAACVVNEEALKRRGNEVGEEEDQAARKPQYFPAGRADSFIGYDLRFHEVWLSEGGGHLIRTMESQAERIFFVCGRWGRRRPFHSTQLVSSPLSHRLLLHFISLRNLFDQGVFSDTVDIKRAPVIWDQ